MPPRRLAAETSGASGCDRCATRIEPASPSDCPSRYMSLTPLAPQHTEAMGAFCHVIGGFYVSDVEKCPQGVAFPLQTPGKYPGLVLTVSVLIHQHTETRIPCPPLPHCGARSVPI